MLETPVESSVSLERAIPMEGLQPLSKGLPNLLSLLGEEKVNGMLMLSSPKLLVKNEMKNTVTDDVSSLVDFDANIGKVLQLWHLIMMSDRLELLTSRVGLTSKTSDELFESVIVCLTSASEIITQCGSLILDLDNEKDSTSSLEAIRHTTKFFDTCQILLSNFNLETAAGDVSRMGRYQATISTVLSTLIIQFSILTSAESVAEPDSSSSSTVVETVLSRSPDIAVFIADCLQRTVDVETSVAFLRRCAKKWHKKHGMMNLRLGECTLNLLEGSGATIKKSDTVLLEEVIMAAEVACTAASTALCSSHSMELSESPPDLPVSLSSAPDCLLRATSLKYRVHQLVEQNKNASLRVESTSSRDLLRAIHWHPTLVSLVFVNEFLSNLPLIKAEA